MKRNSKILIGVAVVVAVLTGAYFTNVGGLKGCIGRSCTSRGSASLPDFAVKGGAFTKSSSGPAYTYLTVYFKNKASVPTTSEMSVFTDNYDEDIAPMYAMNKLKNTTAFISNDFLLSDLCKGHKVFAPYINISIDHDNKIKESDETNNFMPIEASTQCITNDSITRGEFFHGLALIVSNKEQTNYWDFDDVVFSDVKKGSTYFNSIAFLYKQGLVKGYADGQFKPDSFLSRAEAAKILYNVYEKYKGLPTNATLTSAYADVYCGTGEMASCPWYYSPIQLSAGVGFLDVKPFAGLNFRPNDSITSLEASTMINSLNNFIW
jgi:hypothetical protein